jgi:hypothetical protein
MAVHKPIRSNSSTQPTRRRLDPPNQASMNDPQFKSQLFATLAHLNRGYGIALAAFDRLRKQDRRQRPSAFPAACLNNFRNQTEELRASANRDLLRLMATREELDAQRFNRFRDQSAEPDSNRR